MPLSSLTTARFRTLFEAAPKVVQEKAQAAYRRWAENPDHPSLRFKKVHDRLPIYSVRIDLNWRAVGVLKGNTVIWFWIGSHDDYDHLLRML
jgi:hypothetical protein